MTCEKSVKIPKGVIKIRKKKTDRQHNGQTKVTCIAPTKYLDECYDM